MLALISPAKKLEFDPSKNGAGVTQPAFLDESEALIAVLRGLAPARIKALMGLSDKLTDLNVARYKNFSTPFDTGNAAAAAYTFRGDTYVGLDADSLSAEDIAYAQGTLRILSGLYGLLRPLDLMQPYRLEMGTKLTNPRGEDLYDFWAGLLTGACNDALKDHKDKTVISLASNEYIKAIDPARLTGGFVTCHFKELKAEGPKVIGLFAKRARGAMARYMIQNRVETPEGLKDFNADGYEFQPSLSSDTDFVFLRERGT